LCNDCHDMVHEDCVDCGDSVHDSEQMTCDNHSYHNRNRESDVYCESCYRDEHTDCIGCGDSYPNDNLTHCEGGNEWCQNCYDENFTSCVECGCELDRNGCDIYTDRDGDPACEEHAGRREGDEWDQKRNWTGCKEYDKIGSDRKFGVELETDESPDYEDWADGCDWGAKHDGSTNGMEFVSPPMRGNDGFDSVMEFTKKMDRNGCEVNDSCGFHLHIDLSDTDAGQRKSIALAYHYTRMVWESFVDESRRDTNYARRNVGSRHGIGDYWNRTKILASNSKPEVSSRYVWINWDSYDKFRTVEVRSHEPTCDGETVCNWIKAHTRFVDYISKLTVGQVTRMFGSENKKEIMRELRFIWNDDDLSAYYTRKAKNG